MQLSNALWRVPLILDKRSDEIRGKMKKKKYVRDEIVEEVVRRFKAGESVRKLSEEFDIGQTTIRDWFSGRARTGKRFNSSNMSLSEFKRINRLEKENNSLRILLKELAKGIKKQKNLRLS